MSDFETAIRSLLRLNNGDAMNILIRIADRQKRDEFLRAVDRQMGARNAFVMSELEDEGVGIDAATVRVL